MTIENESVSYWFVGASYDSVDQVERFLKKGIWENGYEDRYLEIVKSVKPGDKIAIKAAYTRKNNLPFENHGNSVSVMAIKAIGTVKRNHGDGRFLDVEWQSLDPLKEWYFYTNLRTIWKVSPDVWYSKGLIDFAFHGIPQDYSKFRNSPFYAERYGDRKVVGQNFFWTDFYEELASALLRYRSDRKPLIKGLHEISKEIDGLNILNDRKENGSLKPLEDVCPFTVFALFNRQIKEETRKNILRELAKFLKIERELPAAFQALPVVNNQRTWFFSYEYIRQQDDIDNLWKVFEAAISYADTDDDKARSVFETSYDEALKINGVGWNLSMGLFWIRPWQFVPLDGPSKVYIEGKLGIKIGLNGHQKRCSGLDYLKLLDHLETRFKEEAYPVHSFPELSLAAFKYNPSQNDMVANSSQWRDLLLSRIKEFCQQQNSNEFSRKDFLPRYKEEFQRHFPENSSIEYSVNKNFQLLRDDGLIEFLERGKYRLLVDLDSIEVDEPDSGELIAKKVFLENYSVADIIKDGCFLREQEIHRILERFRTKKNLILQGPPGTGKTWLAKRLALALIGKKDDSKIKAVQFHPNLSYEDFVRGFRPTAESTLALCNGPFMEMIEQAKGNPAEKYVLVIEEINRGNPAQIFGEMLTLLEADKRTPDEALELCYRDEAKPGEKVFIPDNLYVIGTMNIADRSLALVDFALRRRFAFIDLEPQLNDTWRDWLVNECGAAQAIVNRIQGKIVELNKMIEEDSTLGRQFRVGHSYVTPPLKARIENIENWFVQVVETEIYPLLEEYWFDSPKSAQEAKKRLLEGF